MSNWQATVCHVADFWFLTLRLPGCAMRQRRCRGGECRGAEWSSKEDGGDSQIQGVAARFLQPFHEITMISYTVRTGLLFQHFSILSRASFHHANLQTQGNNVIGVTTNRSKRTHRMKEMLQSALSTQVSQAMKEMLQILSEVPQEKRMELFMGISSANDALVYL